MSPQIPTIIPQRIFRVPFTAQSVFWAGRRHDPLTVTVARLHRAGDIESNPGPALSKLSQSNISNHNQNHKNSSHINKTNETKLKILQININGINNKFTELQQLTKEESPDIITIQETKLTSKTKRCHLQGYSTIRKDRIDKNGGGLITYIKDSIPFSELDYKPKENKTNIETSITKIHISKVKQYHIVNTYIPPRDSQIDTKQEDKEITEHLNHFFSLSNSIITGDINAHSKMWHSNTNDHRGSLISDIINNSDHITLNTNTHTRTPFAKNQCNTSPDITIIPNDIFLNSSWKTNYALSSDHLPIITVINTRTHFKLSTLRNSFTNYNKANWENFTQEIDEFLIDCPQPTNVHVGNKTLTNAILTADKHNIPKGKIKNQQHPLPSEILDLIHERNQIRKINSKDLRIKDLNDNINKQIQQHKAKLYENKLKQNWDHKTNSYIFWNTIHDLQNKSNKQEINRSITFNNKEKTTAEGKVEEFNKQFINVKKHSTNKINRKITKNVKKLPNSPEIKISTIQIQEAIKASKNNNSTGPDNINIKHLKHLGPIALEYLKDIYNIALNKNIIPQIWKLAKIVPIAKPQKNPNEGSSYRPISLLSPIAKTLEKIILPTIIGNTEQLEYQHGFKKHHSTITALHKINHTIAEGFNTKLKRNDRPLRTILVALDMSKAFDTVNINLLINKLLSTNIPNSLIKFLANYLKGRQAYTTLQNKN